MLEPSSEDTSHLFMLLFPQISLSGLKSPLGWALIDSKASRGCSRNPQDQAGSREGNTRALWVTAPSRGGFPKLRQDWECPNRTSPGQGRTGPGTQGCGGRKGRRNISNRVATPDSLLLLQTPQQCCDTCRNPLLVHLSIHPSIPPSLWTPKICLQAWQCQSMNSRISFSTEHPDPHLHPTQRHSITQILEFPQGLTSASSVTKL